MENVSGVRKEKGKIKHGINFKPSKESNGKKFSTFIMLTNKSHSLLFRDSSNFQMLKLSDVLVLSKDLT